MPVPLGDAGPRWCPIQAKLGDSITATSACLQTTWAGGTLGMQCKPSDRSCSSTGTPPCHKRPSLSLVPTASLNVVFLGCQQHQQPTEPSAIF